jgi:predicted SnoaL-like aldol condensation-catalyzing enzyme
VPVLLLLFGVAVLEAATPEANKASARRFYEEVWFGHKVDVVDELFAPEYLNHDPRDPGKQPRQAPRITQKELARQQTGSTGRIDFQIAEDDRVMTRWIWSMPLVGGWERFVAGKDRVEISVVQIFRFDADGRIAEVWNHRDDRGIDDQMRISGLYYFEGIFFGIVIALVVSKVLRRRTPSLSSQSNTAS